MGVFPLDSVRSNLFTPSQEALLFLFVFNQSVVRFHSAHEWLVTNH